MNSNTINTWYVYDKMNQGCLVLQDPSFLMMFPYVNMFIYYVACQMYDTMIQLQYLQMGMPMSNLFGEPREGMSAKA